jgi:hypothetical protein
MASAGGLVESFATGCCTEQLVSVPAHASVSQRQPPNRLLREIREQFRDRDPERPADPQHDGEARNLGSSLQIAGVGGGDPRRFCQLFLGPAGVEVVPWAELVSLAMETWSQEVVEEALGADVARAIPELLQLSELQVRIPRMEVVALERVAARERQTVSAVLARELRDFVSVHSEWLSIEVPGFAEALAWPDGAAL